MTQMSDSFVSAKDTGSKEDDATCDTTMRTVLVVGATGATGKHVVNQLLDIGHKVKVIVRSEDKMRGLVSSSNLENLSVTQSSVLDLSETELQKEVGPCDVVVSCLGHNMDFKGMFGHPRLLVTDSVSRLVDAMDLTANEKPKRFILMNSDGVSNPSGADDQRPMHERALLSVLRFLLPPVRDNEAAAKLFHDKGTGSKMEWVVVRPTDLIDGEVSGYQLYDKPKGSLFGSGVATRANVAKAMVDLIGDDKLFESHMFKMPVVHDAESAE